MSLHHYILVGASNNGLAGGPSTGILPLSAQSITSSFNTQILSHFLIPYLLLSSQKPILQKGAQICNIARPGEKNRNIDMDDFLCLKAFEAGTFRLLPAAMKFVFMLDLLTQASTSDNSTCAYR